MNLNMEAHRVCGYRDDDDSDSNRMLVLAMNEEHLLVVFASYTSRIYITKNKWIQYVFSRL